MGVDYEGIGGIGIKVNDELVAKIIDLGFFTGEDWSKDPQGCMSSLNIPYATAGAGSYGGEDRFYFTISAYTYKQVNENKDDFLHIINSTLQTEFTEDDLIVISDLYVW